MGEGKSIAQTDSWTVAFAFFIFAVFSVGIEKLMHVLKHRVRKKRTLLKVIRKAEEEFFLLGTVSLIILTFEEMLIANSCVDSSTFKPHVWALCPAEDTSTGYGYGNNMYAYNPPPPAGYSGRKLLAPSSSDGPCPEGQEPFLSQAVLHQVHHFIFFLAISHVVYSACVLSLGRKRLRALLDDRKAHIKLTMEKVGKMANVPHHELHRAMRERREKNDAASTSTTAADRRGPEVAPAEELKTDRELSVDIVSFTADALTGDLTDAEATAMVSRKSGKYTKSTRTVIRNSNTERKWPSLYETLGVTVPNTTLIRMELLFLRTHNIRSVKFDFSSYALQCIESHSEETLGMSPGRWLLASVILIMWGPIEEINLIISLVSLGLILFLAAWLRRGVDLILAAEKSGTKVSADMFLFGRPRLLEDTFILIIFQQAFHVATWIFGAWQVGVAMKGYECYYGTPYSVAVSFGTMVVSLLLGGYVILPLQALEAQLSDHFRADLMGSHMKAMMKDLAERMERRRTGTRLFRTEEDAILHIQRAFRARKERYLENAAKIAMVDVTASKRKRRLGGGSSLGEGAKSADVKVDIPPP